MATSRAKGFAEYVAQRRPVLYRTALLLCGDPHRAEDIVQNALSKLYVAWPKVHRMEGVDAYARRVVVTSHLDETRRPWRRERVVHDDLLDRPARTALDLGDSEALWQALRELPEGQRRVVVLRHYWGLSIEEVAADLRISSGTVKSQAAAGLARLRHTLAEPVEITGGQA